MTNSINMRDLISQQNNTTMADVPITVVWSAYGHTFQHHSDELVSCMECGAWYYLVHDDPEFPAHGAYQANNGDAPLPCPGVANLDHGEARTSDIPCNCVMCV